MSCPLDTISVEGTYEDDTLGVFNYYWDFGNGYTFNGRFPTVYYDSAGTYVVTLIVSDSTGWADTLQQQIVVPDCDSISSRLSAQIKENISSRNITVFPNPSSGLFTVNFKEISNPYQLYVYNILGTIIKEIKNVTEKEVNLDLRNQPGSIYLIKIDSGKSPSVYKKIIIQ